MLVTQHQGFFFFSLCPASLFPWWEWGWEKKLQEDTAITDDVKWPKVYSIPHDIELWNKSSRIGRGMRDIGGFNVCLFRDLFARKRMDISLLMGSSKLIYFVWLCTHLLFHLLNCHYLYPCVFLSLFIFSLSFKRGEGASCYVGAWLLDGVNPLQSGIPCHNPVPSVACP